MGVVGGTRDTVHLSLILKSLREESPRLTLTDITVHHLAVSGCIDGMGSWGFSQGRGLVLHVWEEGRESHLLTRRIDCGRGSRYGRLGNIKKHKDIWDHENKSWQTGLE